MLTLLGTLLLAATPATRIAVLDLAARGVDPRTAEALSLLLPTEVRRRVPGAVVTSGSELAQLLGIERQKQLLGCNEDSSCVMELVNALGTGELVRGTVGRVGEIWLLELQHLDLAKQRPLGSTTRTVNREEGLIGALREAVEELLPLGAEGPRTARPLGLPILLWASGAALIAAGSVGLGVEQAIQARFDAQQPGGSAAATPTVTRAESQTAQVLFPLSIAALGLGVVGLVAGTWRYASSEPVAVALVPHPGGLSLAVGGAF